MAVYKVNISLDPQLLEEIDDSAKALGLSRSGFVAEATARYVADVRNLSADELRRQNIDRGCATFQRIGKSLPPHVVDQMLDQLRKDRERGIPEGWTE